MRIVVSGGLDLAFNDQKSFQLDYPNSEQIPIKDVITRLGNMIQEGGSDVGVFLQDGLIRPGILVLINDADWELLDGEDSFVQNSDEIHFASTLHGG